MSEIYIKYSLEILNRENGGAKFEQLATDLINKTICSNIIPATGPYSGGDKGQDGTTHTSFITDSDNLFRIWIKSPEPQKEKIVFAFSINKRWKSKVSKDVDKIIKNNLQPDKVIFTTNQFIKEKNKINVIQEIQKEKRVALEILDGTWITNHLKEKYYDLAIKYLGLPATLDPEIEKIIDRILGFRKGGMSKEESLEVKDLLERASYRSRYHSFLEHRMADLKKAADIQSKYEDFYDEAIKNYEEALTEKDNVNDKYLIADTFYNYFKALQKTLAGRIRITKKIDEYLDLIISNKLYEYYKFISVWIFLLLPDYDKKSLGKFNLLGFIDNFLSELNKTPNDLPPHIKASIQETKLLLDSIFSQEDSELINKFKNHLHSVKDIVLYPLTTYARIIATMAPRFYENSEYEDLYNETEQLIGEKESVFSKAQLRKDRAIQLFDAGFMDAAIRDMNIVKFQWFSEETLRGSLLSSWMLHEAYKKLKLYHASIYELYFILQLSTFNRAALHKDLIVSSLAFLYYTYLMAGYSGTAYAFARLAIGAERKYGIKPHPDEPFSENVQRNFPLMLNEVRNKYPTLHDNLLDLFKNHADESLQTYLEIVYSSDEEFEKGFEDPDELAKAKKFRKDLLAGNFSLSKKTDNPVVIDETANLQIIEFSYENISFKVSFTKNYLLRLVAESISSFIQILLVEVIKKYDLCWIEDDIRIVISKEEVSTDYQITEKPNNLFLDLEIKLSNKTIDNFYKPDFEKLNEFEVSLFSILITSSTIEKSEDIKSLYEELLKNGFFERLARRTPYGFLFNKWFGEECFNEIVKKTNNE